MEHDARLPRKGTREEELALVAAKEAVRRVQNELFADLGVNLADFKDIQELREDLAFARRLRVGSTKATARFFMTLVMALAGAAGVALWEFAKAWLHYLGHGGFK